MRISESSEGDFDVVWINKGTKWSRAFFRRLGIMSAREKRRLQAEKDDELLLD